MNNIIKWAANIQNDPTSSYIVKFLGGLISNALGSKVSTIIGTIISYGLIAYADFGSIIPAPYGGIVKVALGFFAFVFGAYMHHANVTANNVVTTP